MEVQAYNRQFQAILDQHKGEAGKMVGLNWYPAGGSTSASGGAGTMTLNAPRKKVANLTPADLTSQAMQGNTDAIAKLLSDQQNQANAANQARYDKLLEMANTYGAQALGANQNAYGQMAGGFQGQANVLTQQNQRLAQQQLGQGQQSLLSRGLGNSTVANTMQAGVARNQMQNQQGIAPSSPSSSRPCAIDAAQ